MAKIRPFSALRPKKEFAERIASPPYDVLDKIEARNIAKENPITFLHVIKPEIDIPDNISIYDDRVYLKGKENLDKFIRDGLMFQENSPKFYIYRQIWGNHTQTGIVACASVDDYEMDIIKKHEATREEKEIDRTKHILTLNAQTGPVFLTYIQRPEINEFVEKIKLEKPEYDFTSEDNVTHTIWIVYSPEYIKTFETIFSSISPLYVADGHHRSAAAARVRNLKKKENPLHTGKEEYNFFLSVIFPHNQMKILPYNRVVKDLNSLSFDKFLSALKNKFIIKESECPVEPAEKHLFGMYLNKRWFVLRANPKIINKEDPVKSLDVAILQDYLLEPILGIKDPRRDKRINFVGGIKGINELIRLVDSGEYSVAFSVFPTSIEDLINVADAHLYMPPKSTWFEPKLKSGLFVHLLD